MILGVGMLGLIAIGVICLVLVVGGAVVLRRRRYTIVDYPELPPPSEDTPG
jgi:hypothetical protein